MSSDAPNSIETIVCLANSRKISGRCVAGKRTGDNSWFRPISNRAGHEISELDRHYSDGKTAQLLDVIEIPCIEERPHGHQSENVLIDDRFYWEKKGRASWDDVLELVDPAADLWANGFSAYYNRNNRVPDGLIDEDGGSLRLIELDEMILHAGPKTPDFGDMKPIVRASFNYRGQHYKLDVTDPEYERACLEKGAGEYRIPSVVAVIAGGVDSNWASAGGTYVWDYWSSDYLVVVSRGVSGAGTAVRGATHCDPTWASSQTFRTPSPARYPRGVCCITTPPHRFPEHRTLVCNLGHAPALKSSSMSTQFWTCRMGGRLSRRSACRR